MNRARLRCVALAAAVLVAGFAGEARAFSIQTVTSPGGITAWLIEDHSLPMVALNVAFRDAGGVGDPAEKSGLANFTADLLDEGAGDLDSMAFKGRLEDLASSLQFAVDDDMLNISLRTLTANVAPAFDLVRQSLTVPRFTDDAVARVRAQLLSQIDRAGHDPHSVANLVWWKTAFPASAYGRSTDGTADSVGRIVPDDMRDFMRDRIAKDAILIGVVGDIAPGDLGALLDKTFGGLPARAPPLAVATMAARSDSDLLLVPMPIPQSVVAFGQPGIARDDPDFYAAMLITDILGGNGLTSRLSQEVREKRGLAYSVYLGLEPLQHGAVIQGGVATENARVAQSIAIIRDECKRMRDQGPTAAELAASKTYLTGSFPLGLDSMPRIAGLLVIMQRDHLGTNYLTARSGLIDRVTLDDAKRVAKRILDPGALSFVVVGTPENLAGARVVSPHGG